MLITFTTIMSLVTILVMWLAGNGDKRAWVLGLCNQALWLGFIFITKSYGLLILTAALIVVYIRNLRVKPTGPYTHTYTENIVVDWDGRYPRYPDWDDEFWNLEDDGNPA